MEHQFDEIQSVAKRLTEQGLTLSAAESCTGGLLSAKITDVPGASKFYKGGVCTYCNEMKNQILGVRQETLDMFTAVSEQTAAEMAAGCARVFGTDIAIGITGYAGPEGGEDGTPVGTIYIGISCKGKVRVKRLYDPSGRANARENVCKEAALMVLTEIEKI
jgi:PncC family amidohydrolase